MKLRDRLSEEIEKCVGEQWERLSEIRLRCNRPSRYRTIDGQELSGTTITAPKLLKIAHILMENSVYACEEELKEGFFTAEEGCRVGVCGKMSLREGRVHMLSAIGSVCIRIPRAVKGCADVLKPYLDENLLVLSPPGLGKTTLLRDLARLASDSGRNVAIADERRELCACREGIPQLDVGERTDVIDGCPKAQAIPMLIRACAPDMIVADEIGKTEDAEVLLDAARCGVCIAASAHARSVDEAFARKYLADILKSGVFSRAILLGERPGRILEIRKLHCGVN